MTRIDQKRLAHIRIKMEWWKANRPCAEYWESVFLLKVIDDLLARKEKST